MKGTRTLCLVAALLANTVMASEFAVWSRSASNFNFNLRCGLDEEHLVQASTNLIDWQTLLRSFGPSTNRPFQFAVSNSPGSGQRFFRTVRTNEPFGIIAKQTILMSGGAYVDSFDSSDPNYSTGGAFDFLKRKDKAIVASLSAWTPAIATGTGMIFGRAMTGPGGTATGTIGDGAWCAVNNGIQPGHVRDDFNASLPDVSLPPRNFVPLPAAVSNQWVLPGGDYTVYGNLSISGGQSMIIAGQVRLRTTVDFGTTNSGYIQINAGSSLEIYLGGNGKFSGGGIINSNVLADSCRVYGLPACRTITYSGSVPYLGTIQAPQARLTFSGGWDACGAFIADSVVIIGPMGIHCDDALSSRP